MSVSEQDIAPENTVAIILGAHKWLASPELDKDTYKRSADEFHEYLESKEGFGFSHALNGQSRILSLFGKTHRQDNLTELTPDNTLREIENFIKDWKRASPHLENIIFYYVGHGESKGDVLYLATANTDSQRLKTTGVDISAVAESFARCADKLRWFLILDCCYAGLAEEKFGNAAYSSAGTAILGACTSKAEGLNDDGQGYTLFSGALLAILKGGKPDSERSLSFRNLSDGVSDLVQGRGPQPCLDFLPSDKNITNLPVFPNPAANPLVLIRNLRVHVDVVFSEIKSRLNAIEADVAIISQLEAHRDTLERSSKALEAKSAELDAQMSLFGQFQSQIEKQIDAIQKAQNRSQHDLALLLGGKIKGSGDDHQPSGVPNQVSKLQQVSKLWWQSPYLIWTLVILISLFMIWALLPSGK